MINIQKYFYNQNLDVCLDFVNSLFDAEDDTILINLEKLVFADPVGLCLMAAARDKLAAQNKVIKFINPSNEVGRYLERMDLLTSDNSDIKNIVHRKHVSGSLMEIQLLNNRGEVDQCAAKLSETIVGLIPGLDALNRDENDCHTEADRIERPLCYIFSELLENALTHGRRCGYWMAKVWVAAQYYPKKDNIRLGIVDDGCGYLASLGNQTKVLIKSDIHAIKFALSPFSSCNRQVGLSGESINQGIGLTVVQEMVKKACGIMHITSGNGLIVILNNGNSVQKNVVHRQGVTISLEFQRKSIKNIKIHDIIKKYQEIPNNIDIDFKD